MGQCHHHHRALGAVVLRQHVAAMGAGDFAHDGQAQALAQVFAGAVVALKHGFFQRVGDAAAAIGHANLYALYARAQRDTHRASTLRVVEQGVVHQVVQRRAQQDAVGA